MNKQKFGNIELGDVQVENLYKDTIDLSMNQSAGLAIATMRKRYGFEPSADSNKLNDQLNEIMIHARREMRKRIQDYLEAYSNNCPVS